MGVEGTSHPPPLSVPVCPGMGPGGDRGDDVFGTAHHTDEEEAQSGPWFSQGHTAGNVGMRPCPVFPSHAFSGECCAHQPAVSWEGPGHRLFGSIIASTGSRLPYPPSLVLLSFPVDSEFPGWRDQSVPERPLCPGRDQPLQLLPSGTASLRGNERVLERDGGGDCSTWCMQLMPLNCSLTVAHFMSFVFYHNKKAQNNLSKKAHDS